MKRIEKLFNYPITPKAVLNLMKIILASQSPRRKKLLEQLGLTFEVIPSSINEDISGFEPPAFVEELALQKAQDVATSLHKCLVIGADTIVVLDGEILGKPSNHIEASQMLSKLSSKTHSVFTGVAFVQADKINNNNRTHVFSVETKVTFGTLASNEIDAYVATGSPMDKAGSYGIQDDWGAVFVEGINGDYNNVVGLPIYKFYQELKSFAPEALKNLVLPH